MVDITKRSVKGSPLTNDEVDDNFDNLNTGKVGVEDIGTDPNQVPLNQYLGSMAYQDLENVVVGELTADSADINGGTIDGTTIGGSSAAAGTFTTLNATGGGALTGTWTDLGSVTTVDINGGTIDGVTIGGSSAGAITGTTGQFNTSLNVDGTATLDNLSVNDGTDGVINIGTSTYVTTSTSTLNFQTGWGDSGYRRLEMRGFDSGSSGAKRGGLLNFSQIGRPGVSDRSVLYFSNSEIVFNDDGTNLDFRVESDTNTHALFVDAGNGRVGINNSNPAKPLDVISEARITSAGDEDHFLLFRENQIICYRGNDLSSAFTVGTRYPQDVSLYVNNGTSMLRLDGNAVESVFNEGGNDINFRVESDNNANMLFVDAGNDRVGIGTSSPSRSFQAAGNSQISWFAAETYNKTVSASGTAVLDIVGNPAFVKVYIWVGFVSNFGLQSHFEYATLTVNSTTGGGGTAIVRHLNGNTGNFQVATGDFAVTRPGSGVLRITYTNQAFGTNAVSFYIQGAFSSASIT